MQDAALFAIVSKADVWVGIFMVSIVGFVLGITADRWYRDLK